MVFLVLTRRGFDGLAPMAAALQPILWINAGLLTADEIANLRSAGLAVTTFEDAISADDDDAVVTARETVQLHHPDEVIWTER